MAKVYIAGRFEARGRLQELSEKLKDYGLECNSRWFHEPTDQNPIEGARRDLLDIRDASVLILDTLDEDDRGGREVEWGYALARQQYHDRMEPEMRATWVVGPIRNIFHYLADKHFNTWEELFSYLEKRVHSHE